MEKDELMANLSSGSTHTTAALRCGWETCQCGSVREAAELRLGLASPRYQAIRLRTVREAPDEAFLRCDLRRHPREYRGDVRGIEWSLAHGRLIRGV